jgi:hypothetical protein
VTGSSAIVGPRSRPRLRFACRAVIVLVLAMLTVFSIASWFVPIALGFKALVIGLPCALAGGGFVYGIATENRRLTPRVSLKAIGRRAIGAMTTYVVLGLGAAGYISGAVAGPTGCPAGVSGTCYQTASWAIRDGRYYELWPYDARGDSISNAPWVQITRGAYIAGAGADFRGADDFGIFVVGFAYLQLVGMEASAAKYVEDRARRMPLEVRSMLPGPNEPRT